jgi:GDP-L-fucose synthase
MVNYLKDKTVFLAGATGLAGIGILKYIIEAYPTTTVRAAYFSTLEPVVKHDRIEYIRGDLRSLDDCKRLAQGCDCAIMAAAHTGGAGFVTSHPWDHIRENLMMNTNMLDAFLCEGVRRIVYVGSATLYQEFDGHIKEEGLDLNREPASAYRGFGWAVRFIEKMCVFLHERYGIEVVMTRVSNIYGPYAKFDSKNANFIPAIVRKAAEKMDPFEVWGSPDVTRDVLYADDFARATVLLADNDAIKCDVFNIGSGKITSVGEVVESALRCARYKPEEIRYLHDKPTTMRHRALDCTKVREIIGWEAKCGIEEGIKKTLEWWEANKGWWKK